MYSERHTVLHTVAIRIEACRSKRRIAACSHADTLVARRVQNRRRVRQAILTPVRFDRRHPLHTIADIGIIFPLNEVSSLFASLEVADILTNELMGTRYEMTVAVDISIELEARGCFITL